MQKWVCGKNNDLSDLNKIDILDLKATYSLDEIKWLKPIDAKKLIERFSDAIDINYLLNNPRRIDSMLDIIESMCDYIEKNELNILKLSSKELNDFRYVFWELRKKVLVLERNPLLINIKNDIIELKNEKINPIVYKLNPSLKFNK